MLVFLYENYLICISSEIDYNRYFLYKISANWPIKSHEDEKKVKKFFLRIIDNFALYITIYYTNIYIKIIQTIYDVGEKTSI